MRCISLALMGVLVWAAAWSAGADLVGKDNPQVEAVAEPILAGVLKGFNDGDYDVYAKNFDATLKDVISPKKFQQTRSDILKKIGACQSSSYLGYLIKGKTTVVLWKGRFTQSADDVLIKLVLSRRGDQTKVLGLWFQ